jgi:hypothetical protein
MTRIPHMVFQMRIAVEFEAARAIVDGPLGTRRFLHVASGGFEGPSIRGEILPGSGDWILVRRDGSSELDIRFTLRTAEDELVYLRGAGLFAADEAVIARIRSGGRVSPDDYYFRTTILFETAAARLNHLNRMLHIGMGQRTSTGMITEIFSVS